MMPDVTNCNSFDVIVVFICLFFMGRGIWIGFVRQIASMLALIGGYLLAGKFGGLLSPYVGMMIPDPKINFMVSFLLFFFLTVLVTVSAGRVLRKVMEITFLGWFDRLLGVCLGAAKALLVASIIYMVMAATISSSNDLLRKSCSAPYLSLGAAYLQQFIGDKELRERFIPRKPAIKKPEPVIMDEKKKNV